MISPRSRGDMAWWDSKTNNLIKIEENGLCRCRSSGLLCVVMFGIEESRYPSRLGGSYGLLVIPDFILSFPIQTKQALYYNHGLTIDK